MKHVYVVEVESGCTDDNYALIFDSVWDCEEKAIEYCRRFKRDKNVWHSQNIDHEITKVTLNALA